MGQAWRPAGPTGAHTGGRSRRCGALVPPRVTTSRGRTSGAAAGSDAARPGGRGSAQRNSGRATAGGAALSAAAPGTT